MPGKISDLIRIASNLTFKRFLNLILLYFSFYLSKILKKPFVFGKPFTISIEPTTACNLSCPECPSGLKSFTRKQGKITLENNKRILDELSKTVLYINYYFQGEPFIHPNFLDLIKEAKKRKCYTSTSSNAHFITDENIEQIINSGLDRLIISLDGLSQKTYENYRIGGKIDKVFNAINLLTKKKEELKSKTPYLIVQFLAVKQNESEINSLKLWAKSNKINELRIKTAQFYSYENGHSMMPDNLKYSRYKKNQNGKYSLKNKMKNECWRMWSSCVFTWDTNIVPCCFDKDAKHIIGSLNEKDSNFEKIWFSNAYKQFRAQILINRESIDICKNCSEGSKVWI